MITPKPCHKAFLASLIMAIIISVFALILSPAYAQRAALVDTAIAKQADVNEGRKFIARLVPLEAGDIAARISGPIQAIFVEEGAMVNEGDLLAQIDDQKYLYQVRVKEADLASAKAAISLAKASYDEIAAQLNRQQRLSDSASFSAAKLEELQLLANTKSAAIDEAKARVGRAQADLDLAKLELKWTKIIAPFDGMILNRYINEGGYIQSGMASFNLMNRHSLEVEAEIPAQFLQFVQEGSLANLFLASRNEAITIHLRAIYARENALTRSRIARFSFPDEGLTDDYRLAAGQSVEITMQSQRGMGVLIPKDALVFDGDLAFVYIVQDDIAIRKEVKTSIASGELIAITDGIEAGDIVVIRGNERLSDGQAVTIRN